jgi:hypothetical protein
MLNIHGTTTFTLTFLCSCSDRFCLGQQFGMLEGEANKYILVRFGASLLLLILLHQREDTTISWDTDTAHQTNMAHLMELYTPELAAYEGYSIVGYLYGVHFRILNKGNSRQQRPNYSGEKKHA